MRKKTLTNTFALALIGTTFFSFSAKATSWKDSPSLSEQSQQSQQRLSQALKTTEEHKKNAPAKVQDAQALLDLEREMKERERNIHRGYRDVIVGAVKLVASGVAVGWDGKVDACDLLQLPTAVHAAKQVYDGAKKLGYLENDDSKKAKR